MTEETTLLFSNQRRNGRAFSSLTARGGSLPIGVNVIVQTSTKRAVTYLCFPSMALQEGLQEQ
jgi:hypothetical protein